MVSRWEGDVDGNMHFHIGRQAGQSEFELPMQITFLKWLLASKLGFDTTHMFYLLKQLVYILITLKLI
jgi:hypothetical protein